MGSGIKKHFFSGKLLFSFYKNNGTSELGTHDTFLSGSLTRLLSPIFNCVNPDPYSEYRSLSFRNTDPDPYSEYRSRSVFGIQIRIRNTDLDDPQRCLGTDS